MTRNQISRVLNRTAAGRIQARTGSSGSGTAILAVLFALAAVVPACAQADSTADAVYGQNGNFSTNGVNMGGLSATTLWNPFGVAVDSGGNLYAVDRQNSRVLYYPAGSTTATRVYGQGGSFTTNGCNQGGTSVNSLCNPRHATLDSGGNLYIADFDNGRVLYYPAGSTTATRVYSVSSPQGVAVDSVGNLYVSDYNGNRVLYYPAGSTTATAVYGQGGSLTSTGCNQGGTSANSLCNPRHIALDGGGNLYVADQGNNRVLYYPAGSTTATRVYGTGGSFTSQNGQGGGSSLWNPDTLTVDRGGNLYVGDSSNNRALYYPAGSTTPTAVYGQGGSFTTNTSNNGGIGANGLNTPIGITVDARGNLYIADTNNNRILKYNSAFPAANPLDGTWTQVGNMSNVTNAMFAGNCKLAATCSFNNGIDFWNSFTATGRILFTTGDGLYWGVANISDVAAIMAAAGGVTTPNLAWVDAGENGTDRGSTITGNILYRGPGSPADPWVTLNGSYCANSCNEVLWGENGNGANTALMAAHGGVQVYVLPQQTITFGAAPSPAMYGTSVTVTATGGGSGNPVTFTSATTGVCTVSGTNGATVALIALGTCTITANQAGTVAYAAAAAVNQSFTVTQGTQVIQFAGSVPQSVVWGSGNVTLSATSNASGAVFTFGTTSASTICTVSGTTVTVVGAGTCALSVTAAATTNYLAVTIPVTQNLAITQGTQTISFGAAPSPALTGTNVTVSATGGTSGNAVTFTSATTGVCTVSGTNGATVALVAVGTCTIRANQAGNTNYAAATQVQQSFTVSNAQVIQFAATVPQVAVLGSGNITLSATSNASSPVFTFSTTSAASICTVSGTTVALVGSGTCALSLTAAATGTYAAVTTPVTQNLQVTGTTPGDSTADVVYGQSGNFGGNSCNPGGVTANTLCDPFGMTVDSGGNMYAVDRQNSRVLYFPVGSTTATRVYGQGGSFTTNGCNQGGTSVNSLCNPRHAALDSGGNLYIADTDNGRVLYYPAGSTTSTRAYTGLSSPGGVALDSGGNLYIADTNNNRVLYYPAGSTTATAVYGQGGSFSSTTCNLGGVTANSLCNPRQLALDGGGNLYIADQNNYRVLYYPAGSTTATRVYGKASLTSPDGLSGGAGLWNPYAVAVDRGGNLYVGDSSNNRILYYPAGSTTATAVYGQAGSFTTNTASLGGISANSLDTPIGIAVDTRGNLYEAERNNNRILKYNSAFPAANPLDGTWTQVGNMSYVTNAMFAGDCNLSATCSFNDGTDFWKPFTTPDRILFTTGDGLYWGVANYSDVAALVAAASGDTTPNLAWVSAGENGTDRGATITGNILHRGAGNPEDPWVTLNGSYCANSCNEMLWGENGYVGSQTTLMSAHGGIQVYVHNVTAQTITFGAAPSPAVYGMNVTVSATGGTSGNPVTFTSATTGVCTVSGTNGATVSLIALGTCTISANQAVTAVYTAATQVQQSFTVTRATQTISFGAAPSPTVIATNVTVSATGGASGNPVTFTSATTGVCTVSGTNGATVALIAGGTCTINANQAGTTNYTAATQVQQSFTVTLVPQTISFGALSNQPYGSAAFTVSATGGASGNPVTFTSATTGVCTVSGINGSTVTLVAGGTCTINANQAGTTNYAAAPQVQQSFTVTPLAQTISFGTAPSPSMYGTSVTVSATGGASGNPVTFTSATTSVCTVSGTNGATVALIALGTCTVRANQAATTSYTAAPQVQQSFTVTQAVQVIQFAATVPLVAIIGSGNVTLSATSNAPSPVFTFSTTSAASICTLSGTTVTLVGTGTCVLSVTATGSSNYTAVTTPVTQNLQIAGTAAPDPTADVVYGQGGSFTTTAAAVGAGGLSGPYGVAVDSAGNLYAADRLNNRVLFYPAGSTTATRVYGQGGNLTTNGYGTDANGLNGPQGVSLDSAGNLYIADNVNNRVLFHPAGSTTATRVYGQNGSFTTTQAGASATNLHGPAHALTDSAGNLYIVDNGNNRVLFYPSGSTTATRVYGQNGNFGGGAENGGTGTSANTLSHPAQLALDGSGNLYVVDTGNQRVLYYPAGSTTPTRVYGQSGSFTSNAAGTGANSFENPQSIALDPGGNLYVGDGTHQRVLYFPAGSTTATAVYGQGVNFGITLDARGNLYVADYYRNRILKFNSTFPAANPLDGTWTQVGNMSYITNAMFTGNCNLSATCSSNNGVDFWKSFAAPDKLLFTTGDGLYWGVAKFSDITAIVAAAGGVTTPNITWVSAGENGTDRGSTITGNILYRGAGNAEDPWVTLNGSYCANSCNEVLWGENGFAGSQTTLMLSHGGIQVYASSLLGQTIAFGAAPSPAAFGTNVTVSATGGASGNPVTFTSATTGVCTVSGTNGATVALIAGGTCTITANQAGNTNYAAATAANQTFTVTRAAQTITFGALSAKGNTDAAFGISATASSGLGVSFSSLTTSICTVSGGTVTLTTTSGTCTIQATQAGNSNYAAASAVNQSFTVTLVAQYVTLQTSPAGLQVSIDGGAAQTAPYSVLLTAGSHTIATVATQAGTAGTQYVFSGWSDSGALSHSITVSPAPTTYTATFGTQYLLTTSAGLSGTVTAGGYLNAGTSASITATPSSGFTFSNFTGATTSTSNPLSLLMDAPKSVTANFSAIGAPLLTAIIAAKADGALPNERIWTLQVTNSGTGAITNVRVTSVQVVAVSPATASVTLGSTNYPAALANPALSPGQSSTVPVSVIFPASPTARIQFRINLAGDNGYTNSITLSNVVR